MNEPADIIGAIAEIFTWVGFGAAVVLGIAAAVIVLADGTWLPVRGVVESLPDGPVVRWIDVYGDIGQAPLSRADAAGLGDADMADVYYRKGSLDRMRLHPGSAAARAVGRLAAGFLGLGIVSAAVQLVLLIIEG